MKSGYRVIEIDLDLTSDNELVLVHDWEQFCNMAGIEYDDEALSYEKFISAKIYEKYSTLDISDIITFLIEHTDVYIMLDYKRYDSQEDTVLAFSKLINTIIEQNQIECTDRIIVQLYNYNFKDWVEEVYCFKNYLFTIYALPSFEADEVISYCNQQNIPIITMPIERYTKWIRI